MLVVGILGRERLGVLGECLLDDASSGALYLGGRCLKALVCSP